MLSCPETHRGISIRPSRVPDRHAWSTSAPPRSARCPGARAPATLPETCADPSTGVHPASAVLRNPPSPAPPASRDIGPADAQGAAQIKRIPALRLSGIGSFARLANPLDHRHHARVVFELGDGFLRIPRSRANTKSLRSSQNSLATVDLADFVAEPEQLDPFHRAGLNIGLRQQRQDSRYPAQDPLA